MAADATYLRFDGLWDRIGTTVTAWVCGLDCGDYVVASPGYIIVPFGSDPDGLFTLAWIISASLVVDTGNPQNCQVDVYYSSATHRLVIPVAIGYAYKSRGQLLRPMKQETIRSQVGPGLAKKRRVHEVGILFNATGGKFYLGTDFSVMYPAQFYDSTGGLMDNSTLFSGVYWDTIEDEMSGNGYDGMVCWEIRRPYPATVVSLTGFMELDEA